MNDDTIFEVEDRFYLNPQTSLDEQQQFIETLRDIQAKNTAEINQNTYNLGSPVTSNIGGLTGSEGLWQAQYQTPQTQATVAGLKAAMQQQALNTELQNKQNFWKNRYNQAQRAYNRAASTTPSTTSNTSSSVPDINVNTGNPTGVKVDETITRAQEILGVPESDAAAASAYQLRQGDDQTKINSTSFTYVVNGVPTSGVLYKDNLNRITGAEVFPTTAGPIRTNYTGEDALKFLRQQAQAGRLFDSNMQKVNAGDFAMARWQ